VTGTTTIATAASCGPSPCYVRRRRAPTTPPPPLSADGGDGGAPTAHQQHRGQRSSRVLAAVEASTRTTSAATSPGLHGCSMRRQRRPAAPPPWQRARSGILDGVGDAREQLPLHSVPPVAPPEVVAATRATCAVAVPRRRWMRRRRTKRAPPWPRAERSQLNGYCGAWHQRHLHHSPRMASSALAAAAAPATSVAIYFSSSEVYAATVPKRNVNTHWHSKEHSFLTWSLSMAAIAS